ncbi:MAG: enoyl-CoA hydratase/isomerase family protein [Ginsengibacter sp.]
MITTESYINTHIEHGITTIEFFHPQSNSLPSKLLDELCSEIHLAAIDNDTKVIILKSGGDGAFCAGASFDELSLITNEKQGLKFFSGFAGVINAMRKCRKLIIGRIHGKCAGGGVGIAAAVDYAFATDKAEIKLSELAIGIGPFVIGPAIERKIGTSAFSQLALETSIWHSAEWARLKGLFAEVYTSIENLDEGVYRLADSLAHYNPIALEEMKRVFWKGTDDWDELLKERAAISGRLVLSEFTKNAIKKFKAK